MSRHRLLPLVLVLLTAGLIAAGCGDDDDDGGDGGVDEPSVTLESPEGDTTVEGLEEAQQEAQEQADEARDQAEEGLDDAREACIESVKDSFDGEQEEQGIDTCEESFPE